jgi:calpain-15
MLSRYIARLCRELGEPYISYTFQPTLASLYCNSKFPQTHAPVAYTWLRSVNIPSRDRVTSAEKWVVLNRPAPSDIVQGALGNCWFLSALAVLAEKPELVENLFISREYSPAGAYQLQLFSKGEWVQVLLDDTFPVKRDKRFAYVTNQNRPSFTDSMPLF